MFVLLADINVSLSYIDSRCSLDNKSSTYSIKKYINILTEEVLHITEHKAFLFEKNKLIKLEFGFHHENYSNVSVRNMMTDEVTEIIPSKYADNYEDYRAQFAISCRDANINFTSQKFLEEQRKSKTMQQFINEFNSLEKQFIQYKDKLTKNIDETLENKLLNWTQHIQDVDKETKSIKVDIETIEENLAVARDEFRQFVELSKKKVKIYNLIDSNKSILNPDNILDECVAFHKSNKTLCNGDILSTIKLMLNSKHYILSKDFKK